MEKAKRKNDEALRVFERSKMSPIIRVLLVFGGLVLCYGLVTEVGWLATAIAIAISLILSRYGYRDMPSALAIYEDGIEERVGERRFFSSWENLSHMEQRRRPGRRHKVVGLVMHKPMIERHTLKPGRNKKNLYFITVSDVVRVTGMQNHKTHHFQVDAEFYYSELGQILREKAPHMIIQQI